MQTNIPSFKTVRNSWIRALISVWTVIALMIAAAVKWQSENLLKKIPWNYFWLVFVIALIASIVFYTYAGWVFKKRYASNFDEAFDLYLDEKDKLKEEKLASRKQLESDIMKVKMSEID